MYVESLDIEGSFAEALGENPLALALAFGRLTATVRSKRSGQHVSVRARAVRREEESETISTLVAANRIRLETPTSPPIEIGTLHLTGDRANAIVPPWGEGFDKRRLWAARHVLEVAMDRRPVEGANSEILLGATCLICGHPDMTDPESVKRGIGPGCYEQALAAKAALGKHVTAPPRTAAERTKPQNDLEDQLKAEIAAAARTGGLTGVSAESGPEPENMIELEPGEDPRVALARTKEGGDG